MTVRIGIVGTGGFSKKHADILSTMENVVIAAVCGTSKKKADIFAEQYKEATGYDDFNEMLDKQALDGVYLCVPPMAHGSMEMTLIERRIPFFVEKPLGISKEMPEKIVKELAKEPLVTAVGYHFRYSESIQYVKKILEDHKIGMVTGRWMGSMPKVNWWRNQALSGGQFNEQTTHIVDLLRFLVGEVKEVQAYAGHRVMYEQLEDVTVADVGTLNIHFDSGVIANITNTCVLPDGLFEAGFTFYTNKGMIHWSPEVVIIETLAGKEKRKDTMDPYFLEDKVFVDAIVSKDTQHILSTYEDAFLTQCITDAAQKSIKIKGPVKIQ
ncbi:hypothetical protein GCM10012290_19670 [Halolactibacillus alkaliphilus]|uniref:Oxidoreductase n=1 Tax=Halolactibacillus alkaliphilus TaxID=442899 RepID=A0A511X367_9BACI|nr:Gfo/Idh/MocA family oxidoreductase [Halolactibacillus alkaliphilus]GEN57365.1 hypothetical protein HAL01_18290 [Halolactibacillus alkaliphilus]GGN73159.1 hypothetical protein GCM10012290_19670 [Halolactibacillus alkaliphilus]SFO94209.1 Predicted dehydrogenase [Halolactibacillus alkaliphilus]